jgi:hypothetical protein
MEEIMEQLNPLNQGQSYLERCKDGAEAFVFMIAQYPMLTQEFIAQTVAETYQVEIVDMLAETNTNGQ